MPEKREPSCAEVLGWMFVWFCILYTVISLAAKLLPAPGYH